MKKNIVAIMKERENIPATEAEKRFDSVVEAIVHELETGAVVRLPGVGRLERKMTKERKGVNPRTKEVMHILPRAVIKFKPLRAR